jgi:DNA-binding NarL/FixJ family response regulator
MTEVLRVIIADDHPVFRGGLRALLGTDPDFEVVAEAAGGAEAIQLAADLRPDVVLMDLHMPDVDGVEATAQIMRNNPKTAVLVLTMFDDDDSVFASMRAGARGYVLKGTNQAHILHAIHAVGAGGAAFGPAIAERMLACFNRAAAGPFPQLSEREVEVLNLIAEGQPNQRIASRLSISEKTVRNHVSNIFTKLAVTDRTQAALRAREAGLGTAAFRSPTSGPPSS